MISRLRDQLNTSPVVTAVWSTFADAEVAGALARLDFDAVVLDAQHGYHHAGTLVDCIRTITGGGASALVRVPAARWDMCEQALDSGALGVIGPMINTAQDAKAFARAAKYPPIGQRSYGPGHVAGLFGVSPADYVMAANTHTLALAQIETLEAFENLDAILGVEGIDGVFVGPSDLAISVTGNPVPDPYGEGSVKIVRQIASKTGDAGKLAGAFAADARQANLVHELGYRLISVGLDSALIATGSRSIRSVLNF